ncbi:NAD(P)H-hydrate dehydratase [Photobacterium aphoticum]|uniref:NAD(P)H-hydrate dehydratase n=3 Tax=Photobacterium aphoticum TaxID=754436 RepID=UPI0009E628B8|nr:NAD(P)H-hydrate dehydratase [Photobacterium aphoticum]GHA66416.1 bifunctional NAD(P)H-hydrate repair enzyme Nnr [Photobacterium aphoticum]
MGQNTEQSAEQAHHKTVDNINTSVDTFVHTFVNTSVDTIHDVFSAAQVREGERAVAKLLNIEMYALMERAGAAVFDCLQQVCPLASPSSSPLSSLPQASSIHTSTNPSSLPCVSSAQPPSLLVCCGGGNNGGDGYVVARLAQQAGYQVTVWQGSDPARLQGDAARAYHAWCAIGGETCLPEKAVPDGVGVIVDALLGTGLSGTVRETMAAMIAAINCASVPIIAVDLPSGLCADTGRVWGTAVQATHTVTFIGVKRGLVTGRAARHVGALHFAGLGVEKAFAQHCLSTEHLITTSRMDRLLPARDRCAHKGDHGRILLVGGDRGFGGAIRLAAEAAARSGAGLTAALTQSDNALAMLVAIPEIMAQGWQQDGAEAARQRLDWADVLVLGPGLGQSGWSQALYQTLSHTDKPLVLDADGLNLLARAPDYKNNRIITPHPGEAARLLQCSVAEVENDRFSAARALQHRYGGVVVLKGAGTLVDDGHHCWVCTAGNPGMATGGMGDVLSGIIGALLGQGLGLSDAAQCGVWIHSTAADHCAQDGERGMLASDLFPYIRQRVNRR